LLDVARLEGEAAAGTLAAFRLGAGADAGAAVVARETRGIVPLLVVRREWQRGC
jgi:hypothetical protein